jgi:hypothetical protein
VNTGQSREAHNGDQAMGIVGWERAERLRLRAPTIEQLAPSGAPEFVTPADLV